MTAAATSASASASPSCGATVWKSAGKPWVCTFDDEFTAASIDRTKWSVVTTADSGYHSGTECFTAGNVSEANGYLALSSRRLNASIRCAKPVGVYYTRYTSGSVTSLGHFGQTYGLFSVRALFPASVIGGLQSSLWLYPVNATRYGNWPRSGEIDIAENYSDYAHLAIPDIHYRPRGSDPDVTNRNCVIKVGAFHTYTALWTPAGITISVDGTVCVHDAPHPSGGLAAPAPFNMPFMLNLTQAIGVTRNGPSQRTQLPATTYVDYVRVWK
ncbi:glycoside hydrolase family 16 protein [Jatrophihabitans sp.]|uniref:glycoside hydrolase family 16 protein n=1 Tax=Jatrophihabitans sp. TaxID=1932789 RepID=UPI0030C778AB